MFNAFLTDVIDCCQGVNCSETFDSVVEIHTFVVGIPILICEFFDIVVCDEATEISCVF